MIFKKFYLPLTDATEPEQTRRAWETSDAVNKDVYIEGLVEAYPPAKNTGGDSPEHSTKNPSSGLNVSVYKG